jgi:hypothetical protein
LQILYTRVDPLGAGSPTENGVGVKPSRSISFTREVQ